MQAFCRLKGEARRKLKKRGACRPGGELQLVVVAVMEIISCSSKSN